METKIKVALHFSSKWCKLKILGLMDIISVTKWVASTCIPKLIKGWSRVIISHNTFEASSMVIKGNCINTIRLGSSQTLSSTPSAWNQSQCLHTPKITLRRLSLTEKLYLIWPLQPHLIYPCNNLTNQRWAIPSTDQSEAPGSIWIVMCYLDIELINSHHYLIIITSFE